MTRNLYSHSPAAMARLRMGWVSSIPFGAVISQYGYSAVTIAAPPAVLSSVPIALAN